MHEVKKLTHNVWNFSAVAKLYIPSMAEIEDKKASRLIA